jgi:hypothetical protein
MSDMLPFEVPPTFSNRWFYAFLGEHRVSMNEQHISWRKGGPGLELTMRLLMGAKNDATTTETTKIEWGHAATLQRVELKDCRLDTASFKFRVSHKRGSRQLSVAHPRNQIQVAEFYRRHAASILYYCGISNFSIRKPVSISKYTRYTDRTHRQLLDRSGGVEEAEREYDQYGSFFKYRAFSNIHRFFESYKYHRSEKKYDAMLSIDVSRCFDSIYTHSIEWAILGKSQAKFAMKGSKGTFPSRFDKLISSLNERETNGIVIGPEFSRIFAEIILQRIDLDIESYLRDEANLVHKRDYEAFRYVDDYYVFFNNDSTASKFTEVAEVMLDKYKLQLNAAKSKTYAKPIITEMTIAKDRVSQLLRSEMNIELVPVGDADSGASPINTFRTRINANRLIVQLKTAIKETGVGYGDILNYTFAVTENILQETMELYSRSDRSYRSRSSLVKAFIAVAEFMFFAYAASPRVNHTIRLIRALSNMVSFLDKADVGFELKHSALKFFHDNLFHQIEKNRTGEHLQVETLYLLCGLSSLGREYWLPEKVLASHLGVEEAPDGTFSRTGPLNHFGITVGLWYMRDKKRYIRLRSFIAAHATARLEQMKAHCPTDAEAIILLLDLLVCPHLDVKAKKKIGAAYGLTAKQTLDVQAVSTHWFTDWGNYDVPAALDAKRSREVY